MYISLLPWQFFLNWELHILSCLGCNLTFSLYLKSGPGMVEQMTSGSLITEKRFFDPKLSVYEFKMAESLFNNSASWEMCLMAVYVVMDISPYWCNYHMSLILFLQGIGLWSFFFSLGHFLWEDTFPFPSWNPAPLLPPSSANVASSPHDTLVQTRWDASSLPFSRLNLTSGHLWEGERPGFRPTHP